MAKARKCSKVFEPAEPIIRDRQWMGGNVRKKVDRHKWVPGELPVHLVGKFRSVDKCSNCSCERYVVTENKIKNVDIAEARIGQTSVGLPQHVYSKNGVTYPRAPMCI